VETVAFLDSVNAFLDSVNAPRIDSFVKRLWALRHSPAFFEVPGGYVLETTKAHLDAGLTRVRMDLVDVVYPRGSRESPCDDLVNRYSVES
jgi:hypothetical protein